MQIKGVYGKRIYTGDDGCGLYTVEVQDGAYFCCKGKDPLCAAGTPVVVEGELKDGEFVVSSAITDGLSPSAAISYLSGPLFIGIGQTMAQKIVDALNGEDLFVFVQKHKKLPKIKGLSERIEETAVRTILASGQIREFTALCQRFRISYSTAMSLWARYGAEGERFLLEYPYKILQDGLIDFPQADMAARASGILEFDDARVTAVIYQALYRCASSGNTFSALVDLVKLCDRICSEGSYGGHIPGIVLVLKLKELADDHKLVWKESPDGTRVYLRFLEEAECLAAKETKRIESAGSGIEIPINEEAMDAAEASCGIEYDEVQKQAFGVFFSPGIKIITGGPGTGKTTVIRGLIAYMERMHLSYSLCAPTGRAAQRMSEVCGREAGTIHRLLEIRPYGKDEYTCKNRANPINTQYIIVDEVSMVGVELFAQLMGAVKDGATVILVGDTDQLSSVSPGNVLKDLLLAGTESYRLESVFRQEKESLVVKNARLINAGQFRLQTGEGFEVRRYTSDNAGQMAQDAAKLMASCYSKEDMFKVQMLSPVKKGDAGVYALNRISQEILNPSESHMIHKGDRVIFTVNNYEDGYFNGDTAIVESINSTEITVRMLDGLKTLPFECLSDMQLAYAVTVHKSQGSEYGKVIIVLPQCGMLSKNLLYTAVTRAKEGVIIFSEGDALEKCICRDKTARRRSSLAERLQAAG